MYRSITYQETSTPIANVRARIAVIDGVPRLLCVRPEAGYLLHDALAGGFRTSEASQPIALPFDAHTIETEHGTVTAYGARLFYTVPADGQKG